MSAPGDDLGDGFAYTPDERMGRVVLDPEGWAKFCALCDLDPATGMPPVPADPPSPRTLARRGKRTKAGRRARQRLAFGIGCYWWIGPLPVRCACCGGHDEGDGDDVEIAHAPWCRAPDWRGLVRTAAPDAAAAPRP